MNGGIPAVFILETLGPRVLGTSPLRFQSLSSCCTAVVRNPARICDTSTPSFLELRRFQYHTISRISCDASVPVRILVRIAAWLTEEMIGVSTGRREHESGARDLARYAPVSVPNIPRTLSPQTSLRAAAVYFRRQRPDVPQPCVQPASRLACSDGREARPLTLMSQARALSSP